MTKKRILLADADSQILADFRQALGDGWEAVAVATGNAALTEIEKAPFDVVVADLDLAEVNGPEVLNRVQTCHPKTVRFVLANEADHERVIKEVLGAHQFIGRPLDVSKLKGTIERALALEDWLPKQSIRDLVARIRTLPTIPSLYLEVQAALRSQDATTEQIGKIIAKDMAMMTKLLQVINSACFGLPRKITNPTEAVGLLGFETVNSMVMTIKLLSEYDKVKPVYFSIDKLWRHSTEVARSAKQITLWHTEDMALAETAFTGGLLHDLGKVVLASNFDEQYRGAQSLARKQNLPPWEVEKEIFGASHGEIGAYLLGLWGMPIDLQEIAALHHHAAKSIDKTFTPLTAVHIANALEYEMNPEKDGGVVPTIDEEYLAQIGVLDCLQEWRSSVTNREYNRPEAKTRFIKAAVIKNELPPQPAPAPALAFDETSEKTGSSFFRNPWVYASVGVVAAVLILAWFGVGFVTTRAREAQPVAAETATPNPAASETQAATTIAPPATQPAATPETVTQPQPEATPAATEASATPPAKTNVPAPATYSTTQKPATKFPGFPDLRLQCIIFSDAPSAIINGKRVQANEKVNGVLVVNIKSASVLVEYKNQRHTLVLE